MNGCMLHYYMLSKAINKLPKPILAILEYDNDLLFNVSNFNSSSTFFYLFNPFKKDKYDLYTKLNSSEFNSFIIECVQIIKKTEDFKGLLFLYGMICHNIYRKWLISYLNAIKNKSTSIEQALNMLDHFYTLKLDKFDLSKDALNNIFKNGFIYYDFMDNLIHNPLIKTYTFFCSNTYYSKSYRRMNYFYKHMTRSKFGIKKLGYIIYDALFNHLGKPKSKNYIYSSKVDTTLLNLNNKEYSINDIPYNKSFEEINDLALDEILSHFNAVNDYLFLKKEKSLRRLYNINDDIEL